MGPNLLIVVNDGGTGLSLKPQITMGNDWWINITADTPEIWSQDPDDVCEGTSNASDQYFPWIRARLLAVHLRLRLWKHRSYVALERTNKERKHCWWHLITLAHQFTLIAGCYTKTDAGFICWLTWSHAYGSGWSCSVAAGGRHRMWYWLGISSFCRMQNNLIRPP